MADGAFSTLDEMENKQKPFRSRSFSFGTQRKFNLDVNSNKLLKVASSYHKTNELNRDGSHKKTSSFFNFMKRKADVRKSAIKYREMRRGFLRSRNACRYLCNVLRFVGMLISFLAFGFHLNYQWHMGDYSVEIIILATVATTSFTFVVVLYSFFGLKAFSRSIIHFWTSLAYGFIFLQPTHLKRLNTTIMICIMISAGMRCFCSLIERLFKLPIQKSQFLSQSEIFDIVGFSASCIVLPMPQCFDMLLHVAALGFLVINTRMKSPYTILLLAAYVIISGISVIGNIGVATNRYMFVCFVVRMMWDPLLDLYFSRLQPLSRWACFFRLSRAVVFPFLISLLTLDLLFTVVALEAINLHAKYEWPIMIPFIAVSGFCWLILHLTYFAVHVSYLSKLARCRVIAKECCASYDKFLNIMSSQGVKSFSSICHSVASGAAFTTALFGTICWRRGVGTYPAFFLLLLTIESLSVTLFGHLSKTLRGTTCGIGIVGSPSIGSSPGLALPAHTLDVQTNAQTRTENAIKNFFSEHLIEDFGCVGWNATSKMTLALVEKKLEALFTKEAQCDRLPYDSFILLYNGVADEDGSWILADRNKLSFERILKIWNDRMRYKRLHDKPFSRLLIITDAPNSTKWLEKARKVKQTSVAVQTCTYAYENNDQRSDSAVEEATAKRGDFILLWIAFMTSLLNSNQSGEEHPDTIKKDFLSDIRAQGIKGHYAISNSFLLGTLSPANGDFYANSCTLCCLPVVAAVTFLSIHLLAFVTCSVLSQCCSRLCSRWFKRKILDLGGIVLINS